MLRPATQSFPPVAALPWLDGPSAAPAIRITDNGFIRWQGVASDGQAELLADGAYRWVGPDGSVVSCAAPPPPVGGQRPHRRCVAVDSAGNTAVTATTNALRTVYAPDGHLLGLYQAVGTAVRSSASPTTLGSAIAASGVDMPALVDFATGRQPFAGGVTGDPHFITIGGVRISSQPVGDFQARVGDTAHRIQLRVEPMPYQSQVSYVSAVAVGVPGHTIELSLAGGLSIDGGPVHAPRAFVQSQLPAGPAVGLWPPDADGVVHAVVMWPDGSTVSISADTSLGLTIVARLPTAPVGGLFGVRTAGVDAGAPAVPTTAVAGLPDVPTGGARGDFSPRSGTGASVGQVLESWRVPADESLFPDAAPSTAPPGSSATISPAAILAAGKLCAAAGIPGAEDLAACVFDVSRTGDDGYVVHHTELATAADLPVVPPSMTAGWPASTLGAVVSPRDVGLGEQLQGAVGAGGRSYYRLTLDSPVRLEVAGLGCPGRQAARPAPSGVAALRVFDSSGYPVSVRVTLCGTDRTGVLPIGVYYLVVAGPSVGPTVDFRLRLRSV